MGVCSYVAYGESGERCLKAASSLILVYILVSPAVTLIRNASEYQIYDGGYADFTEEIKDSEMSESAEAAFCEGIRKYVCEKFSLSEGDVKVKAFGFEFKSMKAEKIKIILSGKAVFADNRGIADEIVRCGLGECEVELSVK